MIVTVFVTKLPSGFAGRTYEQRGWTFFERSSAELIKPARPYVVEAGKPLGEGRFLWAMVIDSSATEALEGRRPPLAPAAFAEQLRGTPQLQKLYLGSNALGKRTAAALATALETKALRPLPQKARCAVQQHWCVRTTAA